MAIITQPFQRTKITGYNTLKGWVLWYTNNISIKPLYKKALTIRSLLSYPRPSPFSKVCAWRSHTLLRRRCPWLWESLPWLQNQGHLWCHEQDMVLPCHRSHCRHEWHVHHDGCGRVWVCTGQVLCETEIQEHRAQNPKALLN